MDTTPPTRGATLAGRAAFVTGGSRGIGQAIAAALAREGAAVAITGRGVEELEQTQAELGSSAFAVRADLRDPDDAARAVEQAAEHFGGLDILVNNAGVGVFRSVAETSVEEWRSTIDTNLSGVFYCCRAAIPHLRRRGGGWIVNISSLASTNPFPDGAPYCASKAGLNAFSDALMQEVRHDGIRVTCILPGSVATGFSGRGGSGAADWKVQPGDVAQVVLDLLQMPARSLPSRVDLRPSKPPRK